MLVAARKLTALVDTDKPPQPLHIARQDEIGQLIGGFNRLLGTLALREEALKQSERKLSKILENVDVCIYLKDTQGCYLFANRALREFFGASMHEIVGQNDERFFDADTLAQLRNNDRLVLKEGKTLRTDETNLKLIDGRTITTFSVKLPLHNEAGEIYALCGISTDITNRKQAEEELRIAATAFECQEGIVVMDASLKILRVNQTFTQITGYSLQEAKGKTTAILRSERHPTFFYEGVWSEIKRTGAWRGEMWHRRKNGEDFFTQCAITVVRDANAQRTHYVANFTDATSRYQQEQQCLLNEAAHRDLLVREVHHRIKNNLQGITGLLRQFAQHHPEMAEPIQQAIGQVQGISVIHGLQGRAVTSSVRLCELTGAIAGEIQNLWQTPVNVGIPPQWIPCVIAEKEAVPLALILNELIVNAVKHGGQAQNHVGITLRKGPRPDVFQISISNAGQLATGQGQTGARRHGLQLIAALMPRHGARLVREQQGELVVTLLELEPPVVFPDQKEPT